MEKTTFVKIKAKSSFIDKLRNTITGKPPCCKGIVEQAEEIVEEYILNCRLQGITLYKKSKKTGGKKAVIAIVSIIAVATITYLIFV